MDERETPAATTRWYHLAPGEGVPGFGDAVKASRLSTGGGMTVIESHTYGGAPRHVHTHEDEYFYVLEGRITVSVGDEECEAGPGSFVYLPRGVPHHWDVLEGGPARLLMMTVPAMLEEFLKEFHAASGAERAEVAARYGITFL